jgi:Fibronectin type III domain
MQPGPSHGHAEAKPTTGGMRISPPRLKAGTEERAMNRSGGQHRLAARVRRVRLGRRRGVRHLGVGVVMAGALMTLTGCVADPPPLIGTAVAGDSQAVVSWQPPLAFPAPITAYVVTPYVGPVAQPSVQFNSTATTETVTGLTNGTTYTFTVTAINALGDESTSSWSSNPVTPQIALPSTFVAHYTGPATGGSDATNGDLTITGAVGINGCSVSNGCFFDVTGVTGTWHSLDICGPEIGADLTADSTTGSGNGFIEESSTSSTGFDGWLSFTVDNIPFPCPGGADNVQAFSASTNGPPYQPWQPGAMHTDWTSSVSGTFSINWGY